jgi:adenylate cyclase class 2
MAMKYEVEQKFPVQDFGEMERKLVALGGEFASAIEQVDRYFAHPARDFAKTDEALRIRRTGEENRITYKGPKLDLQTKTRQELELPLPPGRQAAEDFSSLLHALGFRRVAEVFKRRRKLHFSWQGFEVEASLDEVERVGRFVELEIVADHQRLDAARESLLALAKELGLETIERRSYLELLLDQVI